MNGINGVQAPFMQNTPAPAPLPKETQGFGDFLKTALQQVNEAQQTSDQLTTDLAVGKTASIHEVMIASEKASLSLQLTLQVRNKAVEAYQEMMRMQV